MPESSHDTTSAGATPGDLTCPNCLRDRPESFCPQCGQSDRDYVRSLGSVTGEFFRETFEFDSRLTQSLKLLLFKPGRLTTEFSRNRRAGSVSPVRLYIFASFVFFLVMSATGALDTPQIRVGLSDADRALVEGVLPSDERVEAFKAALPEDYRSKVDAILDRPEEDPMRVVVLGVAATEDPGEMGPIDKFFVLGMIDLFHDPSIIGQRLIGNMPIAMFFLLPMFALALAVFQFRKKRFYVEHLVFALHVHTFTFVAYTVALLLPGSGPGVWFRLGCVLLPGPYLLIALQRYYGDGWLLTVAKSIGVGLLYSLVLFPVFLISIFMTG